RNGGLMDISKDLHSWTLDVVREIVATHEFEPGQFDFKSALVSSGSDRGDRDALVTSIQRTACSMANSDGGFIMFGIKDRAEAVTRLEDRIMGIPLGEDLRRQFGDKVQGIRRDLYFDAIPRALALPTDTSRGVFVVYIPASPLRPHMVVKEGVFYRRGEGG